MEFNCFEMIIFVDNCFKGEGTTAPFYAQITNEKHKQMKNGGKTQTNPVIILNWIKNKETAYSSQ